MRRLRGPVVLNGRKLEQRMRRLGIASQRELSARAGVHWVTTCRAMTGKKVNLRTAAKLCIPLGLTVEETAIM